MHSFDRKASQDGIDLCSDFSGCDAFFDPFDALNKGTDLPIMSLLLFLDGPNNSGELLVFVFQGPELAVRHPVPVDISEDPSISEAIESMVNSPIKGVVQI